MVAGIHSGFSATPASIGPRLGARLIDAVILGALAATIGRVFGFGFEWVAVSAAIVIVYFVFMDVYFGATLGKLVFGLRVVGADGGRPSVRESLMREAFTVLGAVPFIGPFLALGAWIWIMLTMRSSTLRQGKHDMLAGGTRVVRIRS